MLLQRLWVVSKLFEAAKREAKIPAVQDAPRIVKLQESLTDLLAAFKQLRTKHQGAVHRYETLLVSTEENAASCAHKLKREADEKDVAQRKLIAKLQSECARAKNQQMTTAAEKVKLQAELNKQRTETLKLEDAVEQLQRARFAENEARVADAVSRDHELKATHAAKLDKVRSAHAAKLAKVQDKLAKVQAELAKVRAELAEA